MKKWALLIVIIVLALVAWGGWSLYDSIATPHAKAQDKAAHWAKHQYNLNKIEQVSDYHGSHAYHVIHAINKKDQPVFVWVPEGKGKSFVKKANQGWSKEKVRKHVIQKLHPKKIMDIHLGVEDQIPVWEVVYRDQDNHYSFYYVRFKDGVWYKNIRL